MFIVGEPVADAPGQIAKLGIPLLEDPVARFALLRHRQAETPAADLELMQVGVRPAHGTPHDVVQLAEMGMGRDQQASPAWRCDAHEGQADPQGERTCDGPASGLVALFGTVPIGAVNLLTRSCSTDPGRSVAGSGPLGPEGPVSARERTCSGPSANSLGHKRT